MARTVEDCQGIPAKFKEYAAEMIRYFDGVEGEQLRPGMVETPGRFLLMLDELTRRKKVNYTTFDAEGYDQFVIVKEIEFYSLCEHHLAPFFGKAHVAYLPDEKIVGLSKIPRTVEYYAKGFQNQERITKEVAERLQLELKPKGVAVVLEAQHMCMCMRGVRTPHSMTTTSKMTGVFKNDLNARNEFLNLIKP